VINKQQWEMNRENPASKCPPFEYLHFEDAKGKSNVRSMFKGLDGSDARAAYFIRELYFARRSTYRNVPFLRV